MSKTYRNILAIDPSGNWNEGKGTTGWVLYNAEDQIIMEHGIISAEDYPSVEAFWEGQLMHFLKIYMMNAAFEPTAVIIEDYSLYADKAKAQINSRMETVRFIGTLQMACWQKKIPYFFQRAVDAKTRWSDKVLRNLKLYPKGLCKHEIDAYRHALHFDLTENGRVSQNFSRPDFIRTKGY